MFSRGWVFDTFWSIVFCCIQPLDHDKQRGTRIYKNIIIYLFFNGDACVELQNSRREFAQHNSRPYIVLKLPCDPHGHTHAMLVFHWLWFTTTHFFYASGITPMHFCFSGRHLVDFINDRVYLLTSPTGFIAGQAIYYNLTKHWIAQAKHSRYSPDHIGLCFL